MFFFWLFCDVKCFTHAQSAVKRNRELKRDKDRDLETDIYRSTEKKNIKEMSDKHGKNRENTFPLNIIQHVPPLFAFRSEKSSHLDLCVYSGKHSLLEALWGKSFLWSRMAAKPRHKREVTSVGQVNSGNCSSSDLTGHEFNAFSGLDTLQYLINSISKTAFQLKQHLWNIFIEILFKIQLKKSGKLLK